MSMYVDDMLYTGDDDKLLVDFKLSMENEFEMTYLGPMMFFLVIQIIQKDARIFICQRKYASKVLQ